MELKTITSIRTDAVYPHPDNPREDMGSLKELAASIGANGILQALTVIHGHYEADGAFVNAGFTVLIGHRRLAAAKLAGLETVPCVVLDPIDRAEQLQIMLAGNMRSSDFAVLEQARGISEMSEMGLTEKEISARTGYSLKTVGNRHRLSMLNQKKLKASLLRCMASVDYTRLDGIEDITACNTVLKDAGTANYGNALQRAFDSQKNRKVYEQWLTVLPGFAEKTEEVDPKRMSMVTACSVLSSAKPKELIVPEDADKVRYFYHANNTGISLYREIKTVVDPVSEYSNSLAPEIGKYTCQLEAVEQRAEASRNAFMRSVSSDAASLGHDLMLEALYEKVIAKKYYADVKKMVSEILSFDYPEYTAADHAAGLKIDEYNADLERKLHELYGKYPDKCLLIILLSMMPDTKTYVKNYDVLPRLSFRMPQYKKNEDIKLLYDILVKMGYVMSEDEKALVSGTHEAFTRLDELKENALTTINEMRAT